MAPTTVVATTRESSCPPRRHGRPITIHDIQAATDRVERWSMRTSYDMLTAGIFERAGVRALLVGDTSAEIVLSCGDPLPVTMNQLVPNLASDPDVNSGPLRRGTHLQPTPRPSVNVGVGHTDTCGRLAANMAAWHAEWDALDAELEPG